VLQFEPKSKVTLLYANRSDENIIFKKELNHLKNQYQQFEYKHFISRKKRIEKNDLMQIHSAKYYICGPDSLKDGIKQLLQDLNVPKSNINIEHFVDGYKPWFGLF
jgi:ring-1,2-phenylacetyl-CoA epoxidase subunit PaaE